ncbi:MAG TPA: gamma carbonic anhydrase family protein [Thermomicrobiaceae bacterium]|nr:gamma carbonic anhydrase family protein [Thermomicrobiaceae bacterium]
MATIIALDGKTPRIGDDVFLAPNAVIIGDVEIADGSSVWFGAVLRGDSGPIRIGRRTNLQDGVIVHLDPGFPTVIGDDVTVGHGAIVHGTVVGDGAQIGMGAITLTGSRIGPGAIVGAGALVPEGSEVPGGAMALGVPARVRRDVSPDERNAVLRTAAGYAARAAKYRDALATARRSEEMAE